MPLDQQSTIWTTIPTPLGNRVFGIAVSVHILNLNLGVEFRTLPEFTEVLILVMFRNGMPCSRYRTLLLYTPPQILKILL